MTSYEDRSACDWNTLMLGQTSSENINFSKVITFCESIKINTSDNIKGTQVCVGNYLGPTSFSG